jgi:non-ribosomal peptide synthetase component F
MTEPLSPAAQAVLDAFLGDAENTGLQIDDMRENIAAALRDAADQVASPIPDDCTADVFNRQLKIRAELLAIAAELEGADA